MSKGEKLIDREPFFDIIPMKMFSAHCPCGKNYEKIVDANVPPENSPLAELREEGWTIIRHRKGKGVTVICPDCNRIEEKEKVERQEKEAHARSLIAEGKNLLAELKL